MTDSVAVAVVGCGHLGTFHARLYKGLPDVELAAVMDILPEKARKLGEELGVSWTTDLADAISRARAVSVATPTTTHHLVAAACLRAGRAVLVEKPLTATYAEGEELVRLAQEQRQVLAVGHVERFNPAFRVAREKIGSPRFIESHRLSTFVPRSLDVDVVLDLMIHDLDLTLGLIPSPVESIDAVGVPVLTAGEDIANARIRFVNGAVANLTASRVSRERVRKIRFFAEGRYLSIDLMERKVDQVILEQMPGEPAASVPPGPHPLSGMSVSGPVGGAPAAIGTPVAPEGESALLAFLEARRLRLVHGPIRVPEANPLEDELKDFLRAVRGGTLEGASGADGLRGLAAALEIHEKVRVSLRRLGLEGAIGQP
jgi:predicted dehydrogenase